LILYICIITSILSTLKQQLADPDYGRTLTGGSVARTRQVIDLPPPQSVDVIEHRVIERYCVHCDAWHTLALDLTGQVIGQSRIGVRR
jgi:hypothetical protein